MLKIKPPDYQFCPFCGKKLEIKIEDKKERKFCSGCKWTYYPHVAASANAIIVKGKKVLMVKRAREPFKNTWMFPAGFIEYGEHPIETITRELKEETGLTLKKAEFFNIFQSEDDPRSPGHFAIFYLVEAEGSKIKTEKEENKDIAWVDINQPPKIGWKWHKYIFRLLQKKGI